MSEGPSTKSEQVNVRLDAAAKRRLKHAASIEGKTVSGFILSSALVRAEETLRTHENMVLTRRDAETFMDAIINPPKPNAKLRAAFDEHRRRVQSR